MNPPDSTKPAGDHGEIEDPMMICPVCEDEFSATGMRWLGAFDVAKLTDKEIHEMAEQINNVWFPDASDDRLHGISDELGPLLDPFWWTDEPDPISPIHVRKTGGAIGLNEVSAMVVSRSTIRLTTSATPLPRCRRPEREDKGSSIDSEHSNESAVDHDLVRQSVRPSAMLACWCGQPC